MNAKSSIFDEKTAPKITYEEDEKSDEEEPSTEQREKDREAQRKADKKLKGENLSNVWSS